MKITHLYQWLFSLLFIAAFSGCTDHRVPAVTPGSVSTRLRVKTITQQLPSSPNSSTVSAFSYDNLNRLSSILAYQLPDSTTAPVELTVYQYDAQNRFIQLRRNQVRRGSVTELYAYSYNSLGQVGSIAYQNNSPLIFGGAFTVNLFYNATNRLTGAGKFFSTGGLSLRESDDVTFTGNNLTLLSASTSGTGMGAPLPSTSFTVTFAYDGNVNPFYGVYVIPASFVYGAAYGFSFYTFYGGISNVFNLSQNNVLSATSVVGSTATTTTYAYTYNSANLPTSRTTTTGGTVVETLRYEYENY